ncbi:hypothetical protein [Lewinella sp. LCG006]|uniref:hypothetical protein n=1 Tax=Lewinella sp. LCG006 TaxID=3231911 RepID=UPI00345F2F58
MAKKRFTEGLDSLFGGTSGPPKESLSLFPEETKPGTAQRDDEKKSNKGFASQLDAFLAEAFENEDASDQNDSSTSKKGKRLAGLDLLIRQTTDAPPKNRPTLSEKRRLTLAFDKQQLSKLKEIAEREGVYLKDLINQLIERYLQERK